MGQQPEDRRREVVDDMDEFHTALMRWLLPEPAIEVALGPGAAEEGAPAWWRGDEEAAASTLAGVRNRATATAPRRSPGRRGAPR